MDTTLTLKALAAFAFVMGLMYLLSLLLKRLGFAGQTLLPGTKRRLKVVESLTLDARRRLVLVRRDNKEHLLVLGPSGETVVETGIPSLSGVEDAPAETSAEIRAFTAAPQREQKNG